MQPSADPDKLNLTKFANIPAQNGQLALIIQTYV